jgi:hypothetical protein
MPNRHLTGYWRWNAVGKLYDYAQQIEEHIQRNGLDVFKTRGAIAMKVGFIIGLVKPDDPDDSVKIAELKSAAEELLGLHLN